MLRLQKKRDLMTEKNFQLFIIAFCLFAMAYFVYGV